MLLFLAKGITVDGSTWVLLLMACLSFSAVRSTANARLVRYAFVGEISIGFIINQCPRNVSCEKQCVTFLIGQKRWFMNLVF